MNNPEIALSPQKRAKHLLEQMTLEEKIAQMVQLAFTEESEKWARLGIGSIINAYDQDVHKMQEIAVNETRLGIPILFAIDCVHGHALNSRATIFPSQLAMAQSFDPDALKTCGEISAKEVLTDGIRWVLSPVLCVGRDARWGRIGETFGEDPYLIGELGCAMTEGYQSVRCGANGEASVLACAKHYVAHAESIGGRDSYEVSVSERKVRQTFLPPFRKAAEAGCATIMSAQHVHDGLPMAAHQRLIQEVFKDEMGFPGFVVTDNRSACAIHEYGVVDTPMKGYRQAVMSGNDMLMSCTKNFDFYEIGIELAKTDTVFAAKVDDAVLRILTVKFACGLFEEPFALLPKELLASDEHIKAALGITEKSMTMLENRQHTLPVDTSRVHSIAVVGPAADNRYSQYGDWTYLNMPFSKNQHEDLSGCYVSYRKGITDRAAAAGIAVLYEQGCDIVDEEFDEIKKAVSVALESDLVIACVGDVNTQNGEHHDRCKLQLTGRQNELLCALKATGKPLVVLLSNGRPLDITWISENADAVLECFNSGAVGGRAAAKILFGDVNPSGKLPVSIPRSVGQIPTFYNYLPGWHGNKYIDEDMGPLYPFGYGLSYTTFSYSNLRAVRAEKNITVSVDVINTGATDGTETAQLYVRDVVASVLQPVKELKGFRRVFLKQGETKSVTFVLPLEALKIVLSDNTLVLESGEFEIMAGGCSADSDLLSTSLFIG